MNPDNFTNEYLEKLKGVKLSDSSRARIRESLQSYASFHPVRVSNPDRSSLRVPYGTSFLSRLNTRPMTGLFVALALVLTGGVSYAAEGSLPGDFLYPVKVGINEEVRSALAVSAEADAEVSASLAAERLNEAEQLSARGELSAETAADLSARFSQHYEDAVANVSAVRASGDVEAASQIRASLLDTVDAHAVILQGLDASLEGNDAGVMLDTVMQLNADLDTNWIINPGPDTNEIPESDTPAPNVDDATPLPRGGETVGGTIYGDVEIEAGQPGVSGSSSGGLDVSF